MLGYVIAQENRHETLVREEEIKFHILGSNPELYMRLWGETSRESIEEELEEIVPEGADDVAALMAELRAIEEEAAS